MDCPFCKMGELKIVMENDLSFAIFDKYPVNPGHMLIIPKRHVSSWFDTTWEEKKAICELLDEAKAFIDREFSPDGYNIGINVGEAAGQTIFHLHVHLIPRYKGDIDDPMGGVRGVIPEKRVYKR
ncbi:HIT family protein [Desulfurobacterium atlanticum]|uniref:Diadenosine tetraphosphate (Ap4A) hydrolase n=1 Tax=Desulfurobacterium atlanticum TaxID=240169 RepID=A0A239AEB7_9BACT|nr:HIT family protein [Desulfurobacterium atlanticum]SNR93243.1 Diadenosine tetraphosphate (Ap4A) hydrolase [Desulfurobacterium atlanticum]